MQFLKTLFWVVLAIVAVIFAMNNWTPPAKINLWAGLIVEIKLPILIFAAFLIGFLPTFSYYRATRWRMRRRLESTERALADVRGVSEPTLAPALSPAPDIEPPAQS
jgi:putative membrane protein